MRNSKMFISPFRLGLLSSATHFVVDLKPIMTSLSARFSPSLFEEVPDHTGEACEGDGVRHEKSERIPFQ
jgi:hypothetical protein